jgi:uncharacterized hydrophobic protein (TIGR00271 family)
MGLLKKVANKIIIKTELTITVDRLLKESKFTFNFFFLVIVSSVIATIGLLNNNTAIIIGAMIIAPLLNPLLCLSMGFLTIKKKMITYGITSLVLGAVIGVLTATATTLLLGRTALPPTVIDLYTVHEFEFILIAFLTGMAGGVASLNAKKSEQLVGVAIAVALIPPISFAGISLAINEITLFQSSITLLTLSILSTSLGAMIVYAAHFLINQLDASEVSINEKK